MTAGPFVWKQATFAPEITVELTDAEIKTRTDQTDATIAFRDISRVYVYRAYSAPFFHILSVEFETCAGANHKFAVSRYGPPNSFALEECRKATLAFLTALRRERTAMEIFLGARPSAAATLTVIGVVLAATAVVSLQNWREIENPLIVLSILGIIVIGTLAKTLTEMNHPKKIGLDEALGMLASEA